MEKSNIILLVLGLAIIITSLILALKVPKPTVFQLWVFRVILALGAASFGAIIPGFIDIDSKIGEIGIRAGGAIALFVIVYLINPPKEVVELARKPV